VQAWLLRVALLSLWLFESTYLLINHGPHLNVIHSHKEYLL